MQARALAIALAAAALSPLACGDDAPEGEAPLELAPRATTQDCLPLSRLVRGATLTFPARLSETGCFDEQGRPAPELIPYRVRAPLWSDGTDKGRFLGLPPGADIEAPAEGLWTLPDGAVLVKSFAYDVPTSEGSKNRVVETRFMVRRHPDWAFSSYRWNEAGTDGERIDEAVVERITAVIDGAPREVAFRFPGPLDCLACHGQPGDAIALRSDQFDVEIGGVSQLEAMRDIGVFGSSGYGGRAPAPLVDPMDAAVDLEGRARAYLHANCAHCHRPGGYSQGALIDLNIETAFADMEVCDVLTPFFVPPGASPYLMVPGVPEQSQLVGRMLRADAWRMPLVGVARIDAAGVTLISDWVRSLEACR